MCLSLLERVNQNEFSINLLKDLSYITEKKENSSPKETIINLFNATNIGNKTLTEAIGNAHCVFDERKNTVDVYKYPDAKLKNFINVLTQQEAEYTDFLCFVDQNQDYDFAIIPEDEYNSFYADEEKEEMQMKIVDSDSFYKAFGMDIWSFEERFISATYTDERENQILITIMINEEEEKFIIDLV
ncbi:hypothetical protein psyc5s11_36750 [Clostridium gelidum]|uniref:Uncharacterized protein n=1 Tax=Clostridium gelidum TaxID=704125 RepID=A0ABN6J1I2_9CLOT|nr:hypothetical protein [Clostridium gelidum]BCZ47608.1 hypothetical protein psyc5s11_36750 [Clostridium gelidum]